jgi:hypothetical protein
MKNRDPYAFLSSRFAADAVFSRPLHRRNLGRVDGQRIECKALPATVRLPFAFAG